jgi:hypothetical protein
MPFVNRDEDLRAGCGPWRRVSSLLEPGLSAGAAPSSCVSETAPLSWRFQRPVGAKPGLATVGLSVAASLRPRCPRPQRRRPASAPRLATTDRPNGDQAHRRNRSWRRLMPERCSASRSRRPRRAGLIDGRAPRGPALESEPSSPARFGPAGSNLTDQACTSGGYAVYLGAADPASRPWPP